ncbi:MAG: hypothetical protein K2K96_10955 [Lachnospiraceae bacterium]|nr:hypothetical protein [Lachnospiraceae bacterium]
MSDRDKKLILILLTAIVIALPYIFYIKDTRVETETMQVEIVTLEERYNKLKEMDDNRDVYLREIDEMHAERDEIVASFPADIRRENYAMFLLQTEYSSNLVLNEETGDMELEYPIIFDSASFGINIETPISSDSMGDTGDDPAAVPVEPMDTDFVAITNASALTYNCYYGGMKYLLKYLMDYEDPMIYSQIDMTMDPETGVVSGALMLNQYAIAGPDREFDKVDFTIQVGSENIDLSLDKNDFRGNEDVGIFGPIIVPEMEEEAPVVEAEGEAPVE